MRRAMTLMTLVALLVGLMAPGAAAFVTKPGDPPPGPVDTDGDGLWDDEEVEVYHTDPRVADEWVGSQNPWIVIYSADGTLTTMFDGELAKSSPKSHGQAVSEVAKAAPKDYRSDAASAVARTDWGR